MGGVGNEEVEEREGKEEKEAEMHTEAAAGPTEGPKSGGRRMRTTTQQEGGGCGGGAFGGVMERGESWGLGEGIQMMGHKGSLVRCRRLDCRLRNRILLLPLLLITIITIAIIILQGCGNLCGCSLRNNGEMGRL